EYQSKVAQSYLNLGNCYADGGKAEGAYREALRLFRGLADRHPDVPLYHQEQARAYHNLGTFYSWSRGGRQLEAAEASTREAVRLRRRLAERYPEVPSYQGDLANSLNTLGIVFKARGNPAAEGSFREAVRQRRRPAERYPEVPSYQRDLVTGL